MELEERAARYVAGVERSTVYAERTDMRDSEEDGIAKADSGRQLRRGALSMRQESEGMGVFITRWR